MKITKQQVKVAFTEASRKLGYFEIRGRGHAPRVSFPSNKCWISHAASLGTDNYDHFCPYAKAGAVRHFPLAVVLEAATTLGLAIATHDREVPIFESRVLSQEERDLAFQRDQEGVGTLKPGFFDSQDADGNSLIYYHVSKLGYEVYRETTIAVFDVLHSEYVETVKFDVPEPVDHVDLTGVNGPACHRCAYSTHVGGETVGLYHGLFCAVNPSKLGQAASCPDYEAQGNAI